MSSYSSDAVAPVRSELAQIEAVVRTLAQQQHDDEANRNTMARDVSTLGQTTSANSEILNRAVDRQHDTENRVASSAAADVESKTDRKQLNDRMAKAEGQINQTLSEMREHFAAERVQLAEIESQFHAVSNLENLRAAQQERLNSILWEKGHPGERYPNGTFFPPSIYHTPAMIDQGQSSQ